MTIQWSGTTSKFSSELWKVGEVLGHNFLSRNYSLKHFHRTGQFVFAQSASTVTASDMGTHNPQLEQWCSVSVRAALSHQQNKHTDMKVAHELCISALIRKQKVLNWKILKVNT